MLDGDGASDRELRDTILNFLIAGRDTTANVLYFLLLFINHNFNIIIIFLGFKLVNLCFMY